MFALLFVLCYDGYIILYREALPMFQSFSPDIISSLSSLELELLRYINANKQAVCNMSIQELAKNTFMSTTTIIRLCKKLNLAGYSHLKFFLREMLSREQSVGKA